MSKPKDHRDPLEEFKILARPGESTYERLQDLIFDKIMFWMLMTGVFFTMFLVDLMRLVWDTKPTPWFWLITTIVIAAFTARRIWRLMPQIRAIRQGLRGERAIGELLEELRKSGYEVFHDLDTPKHGNIDHALIGPGGVFALETKAISKPPNRKARIRFDGDRLLIDGKNPSDFGDRDPMDQARTSASCLREMIKGCTGKTISVRPVLLYPGWLVDERTDLDVWVLNPKRVFAHLRASKRMFTPDDVSYFSENLRSHLNRIKR